MHCNTCHRYEREILYLKQVQDLCLHALAATYRLKITQLQNEFQIVLKELREQMHMELQEARYTFTIQMEDIIEKMNNYGKENASLHNELLNIQHFFSQVSTITSKTKMAPFAQ